MLRISKTGRLEHVNSLLKVSIKKCIIQVKLMDDPISGEIHTKNGLHGGQLENWAKRMITIIDLLLTTVVGD